VTTQPTPGTSGWTDDELTRVGDADPGGHDAHPVTIRLVRSAP
jgi:hypothetical protein